MHFAIAPEHLAFFYRHHYIEFENLLSKAEADDLQKALGKTLQKRLDFSPEKLQNTDIETLFMAGRDTWRDNKQVKKFVLRPSLAEIAAHLVKKRCLRIGYDQVFDTLEKPLDLTNLKALSPLFHKEPSLGQTSGVQGVVCGLMLHLSLPTKLVEQPNPIIEENPAPLIPSPQKVGSGIFFTPDIPLSLEHLFAVPNQHRILIVYCEERTIYCHEKNDPHNHSLKKLGYVFGDLLKNSTHPIVYQN